MASNKSSHVEREIPGIIIGIIIFAAFVAISWFLGETGVFSLGWGGIVMGVVIGGYSGYLYAALDRARRYDYTIAIMLLGYAIGAYMVEIFLPEGQLIVNLATSTSGSAFVVWILGFVFGLVMLVAPLAYAKRRDVR